MNNAHFDHYTLSLAGSRRALVGGTLAAVAGWMTVPASDTKKKRKHKKRKKTCGKAGSTPVKGKCCTKTVNVDGTCRTCDVCASGCAFTTVQAAIDAASDGVTIAICPGTYTENLIIGKDVRLVGAGDGTGTSATILQGAAATSVVKMSTANITLQNLRITGGRGDGGGIFNLGARLDVIGCTISGNTDPRAAGSGIYNLSGTLLMTDSTVSENEAALGGGIFNEGGSAIVQLTNSEIRGNKAADGGGIYVQNGAEVQFDAASRVTENTATAEGGGLFVSQTAGRISLANSANVSDNTPTNCGGTAVDLCSGTAGPR